MPTVKILIVEDEPKVANAIQQGLQENGLKADVAYDGLVGKKMALSGGYSLVILDINLPHINGYELCQIIRAHDPRIPIIMLTALGGVDDKIQAFGTGADDYLVKPFDFRELMARIQVFLKRSSTPEETTKSGNILRVGDLEIDDNSKTVVRGGQQITLTAKEFALLVYLVRNKGRVVSRSDIAEKIWDITFDTGTNVIDVYVNFLRKKIDKNFPTKLIHTRQGMGYMVKEE
ncbi:response regulator transcription factor [Cesiribacter andamanensis]|uniref:Transcriptional activator protein CopR n=1 Tax=Cesiribacter andamanensis AMV16 TaxID=1279009 RepID=M7N9L5_9BACT|nr:response regulator transcription factor [Cesiribacter andamanensis]EMR03891.1 Transcriptional activator protein CopR [Cesiribacter andamanensis AMV16]